MPTPACCICAAYIDISPVIDEKTEKPTPSSQEYPCCSRLICKSCLDQRPQFSNYCPYCQHTGSTSQPSQSPSSSFSPYGVPTQASILNSTIAPAKFKGQRPMEEFNEKEEPAPDVLHFVDPTHDSINTLSIRYGVPATVLRQTNGIFSDHLLAGRKTILISGEYYKGGLSLSPRPIDGEEEDKRKAKIRKWMMACKVVDYEVAVFYLSQVEYDLEVAIMAYKDDERWEKENPLRGKGKAKGIRSTGNMMTSPVRW